MRTKILLLFGILIMSFNTKIISQETPDILIDNFFKDYKESGTEKAINNLYKTSKWASRFEDAINNLKKELAGYNKDLVGEYYGYEFITEKKMASCFLLRSYLLKFDRQPLRLTFEFYKPNDKWIIYSLNIDTKSDDELEESAKIYLLDKN